MPAASDPTPNPAGLPRTWRPLGVRLAAIVLGLMLVAVCAVAWFGWDAETRAKFNGLQRATILAIGLAFAAAGYALARSRVQASASGLLVVNGYRRHSYEWAEVLAVHLPPGAPWAVLDLADGTSMPAMGIQGSDGGRAKEQARQLRQLLAASSAQ